MPLTVCDPSEHRHSLKGLSPVFSLETVASGLWTAGLSDQVHGFPLLFTCSNNLLKVKRCCRGRRHKTGDGCSPCSSSMSLLKENVVSAPLSLHDALPISHVHRVSDAIQPSHPLSSHSLPTFNLSQHLGLFK